MTIERDASVDYPGDGSTVLWDFSFQDGYLDKDYVRARIIDDLTNVSEQYALTDTSWEGPYRLRIEPAVPVGKTLRIYRETPRVPLVTWPSRARIDRDGLAISARQPLHVAAEHSQDISLVQDTLAEVLATGAAVADAADEVNANLDWAERSIRTPVGEPVQELPVAASRAGKVLAFDAFGNVTVAVPATGSAAELAADLSSNSAANKGAGISWFSYALAYASPTIGWAIKQFGGIPAKWLGVTADGVTDDTAALQAAINLVGTGRLGRLRLPPGTIRTTAEITVDYTDVKITGVGSSFENITDAGVTMIKGEHTSGAVLRIKKAGCSVSDLVISATAARTAAGYASTCHGLHVEGADSPSQSLKRTHIHSVRVTLQGASGFVLVGDIAASSIRGCDSDQNGGHGFVVSGGEYTGRANYERPGQLRIESCRTSRNGGHGVKVGHTSDNTTARPYRIDIVNIDSFYNGRTAAAKDVDFDWLIHGENIDISQCAVSGETDAAVPGHGGMRIAGKAIRVLNQRFIDCDVFAAAIANYGGSLGASRDIEIHIGHIQNQNAGAGHYNPAVTIDPATEGAWIHSETDSSSVTSLASTSSKYVRIDWKGTRRYAGEQVLGALRSFASPATLLDDNAGYYTMSESLQGLALISSSTSGGGAALVWFSTGVSSAAVTVLTSSGVTVTGTSVATAASVVDGYGTDGQLTIVATQDQPRLYLSNRTGASRSYQITLLSATGGFISGSTFTQV